MIGEYQIKEIIGVGSSCTVYKARRSDVRCALKVIELEKDPQQGELLLTEFKCLQALSGHPNVLKVIDYSNPGASNKKLGATHSKKSGVAYLATELAQNGSLFALISNFGGLPMAIVKSYAH